MGLKERYTIRKNELFSDESICKENRELFVKVFDFLETKLKRVNKLPRIDEASYKTLNKYFQLLVNTNFWFGNKPWTSLTEEDIRRVYDGLEDEKLKSLSGNVLKCRSDYYKKVFKGIPFRFAQKSDLARTVIAYAIPEEREVTYLEESEFKKIDSVVSVPKHRLLLWLAWDYGENVNSLIKLKKSDFVRRINQRTNKPEFWIRFRKQILKRSRTARTDVNLHDEAVLCIDLVLSQLSDDENVFHFGYASAVKFFKRAIRKTGAVRMPDGREPTWKDLRSGMACYLVGCGWSVERIDVRLGHKLGSGVSSKYFNALAIDKSESKNQFLDANENELRQQVTDSRLEIKRLEVENRDVNLAFESMQTQQHRLNQRLKRNTESLLTVTFELRMLQLQVQRWLQAENVDLRKIPFVHQELCDLFIVR